MSTEYEVGDKVRVTYEGHVAHAGGSNIFSMGGYALPKSGATITVIEKAKKPLKVGDVIEGEAAYAALPQGAVVGLSCGRSLMRTSDGFVTSSGSVSGRGDWRDRRTVVYLPTA